MRQPPSLGSSVSASLSREHSTASATSSSTSMSNVSSLCGSEDWTASHYRRLARENIRREERRRRNAESSRDNRSTAYSTSSSVPDLVGGGSHSRNASVASTPSSAYTVGSLSRNASSASTASSRRYGPGVNVDTVIMEDEDEEEWLTSEPRTYSALPRSQRRRGSNMVIGHGPFEQPKKKEFGMGNDMRDVLERIIQMETDFNLSDPEDLPDKRPATPELVPFRRVGSRPPRTPSPVTGEKRKSVLPAAPGAPARRHRTSMSHNLARPAPPGGRTPPKRPPSMIGLHQSSLSESHTALYLATASPANNTNRRSASPCFQARKSLTFTPEHAGPSIGSTIRFNQSTPSAGSTPSSSSRRRGHFSPSAQHPAMDHWRFPTACGSNTATPTRPPPINTANLPGSFVTPVHNRRAYPGGHQISPQLLWPATNLPPPLAPALFPSSPAANATPESFHTRARNVGAGTPSANTERSGLRLGVLLGSPGNLMDMDDDDDSTTHGHRIDTTAEREGGRYFPVYLEAHGSAPRW